MEPDYVFQCPGCDQEHGIWTSAPNRLKAKWKFDGDMNKPTIRPSLHIKIGKKTICHSIITKGMIQYLSDCMHNMAGKTIELPEISE